MPTAPTARIRRATIKARFFMVSDIFIHRDRLNGVLSFFILFSLNETLGKVMKSDGSGVGPS